MEDPVSLRGRWFHAGELARGYRIPLPAALYRVTLRFVDAWFADGEIDPFDVILEGAGLKLTCTLRPEDFPRSSEWKLVTIDLDEADAWVVVGENIRRQATREQIEAALANVTELRIRGEYFEGVDWGAIDDVVLEAR